MPYLTRRAGSKLVQLLLIGMAVQLVFIAYVFYQSYQGREDVVIAQRKGCNRGKLDRDANAKGWRNAQAARQASGDLKVAAIYATIANGLEQRSRINCHTVYPDAELLP